MAVVLAVVGGAIAASRNGSTTAQTAAAPASTAPAPATLCTTDSCIATDMDQTLTGGVAKDDAVATKAACSPSSVKANAGQTWTATCKVTD